MVALIDSAFDTVTVAPHTARVIMARHAAAGTVGELSDRACGLLEDAAQSGVGIDSALLTDVMTACWDRLGLRSRPVYLPLYQLAAPAKSLCQRYKPSNKTKQAVAWPMRHLVTRDTFPLSSGYRS
jgi:hypothetical protein